MKASNQGPDPTATEPDVDQEEIDSSIATLARPGPDSDGHYIFYDSARHTLEMVNFMNRERGRDERGVKEFFRRLKDEFIGMSVYPDGFREGTTVSTFGDNEEDHLLQGILRRNGWPSKDFQKAKCMEELQEAREEQRKARHGT